jgi:PAS domain S-box-containing protein
LASIGDGVFVVNTDLTLGLINQVAINLSQWKGDDASGKNFREVLKFVSKDNPTGADGKYCDEFIGKVLKTGEWSKMADNTLLLRSDGSTIPVADSAAPLRDNDGRVVGCVVVFRDVTREKEIDRIKDEFLSVASHELRTPMTAIKGYLSMLLEGDYGHVDPGWVDPIQTVMRSTDRLITLVNDLLSVSRLQAGRTKYAMGDFDVSEVIEQEIAELKIIGLGKGLTLEGHDLPRVKVYSDSDKVRQIINNLIGNALKFTDHGGVVISGSVEGDVVKIMVKDTGLGMSSEFCGKLFGKFVQESDSSKGRPAGTGLGLYISQQLSREMGGDVWLVESKVGDGSGSTFGFSIPLAGTALAEQVANKLARLLQVYT